MKKYVVSLAIFLSVQIAHAMELTEQDPLYPFEVAEKNDEKCKLVAKYLHKYPEGRNRKEKEKIDKFYCASLDKGQAVLPSCVILSSRVKEYVKILDHMEAEETWHLMYQNKINENLTIETKQKIFELILHEDIVRYCIVDSTVKFVQLDIKAVNASGRNLNKDYVYFIKKSFLDELLKDHLSRIWFEYKEDRLCEADNVEIGSVGYFIGMGIQPKVVTCKRPATQKLIVFLKAKNERVDDFKKILAFHTESLLKINEEQKAINTFLDILKQFKDLTKYKTSSLGDISKHFS